MYYGTINLIIPKTHRAYDEMFPFHQENSPELKTLEEAKRWVETHAGGVAYRSKLMGLLQPNGDGEVTKDTNEGWFFNGKEWVANG